MSNELKEAQGSSEGPIVFESRLGAADIAGLTLEMYNRMGALGVYLKWGYLINLVCLCGLAAILIMRFIENCFSDDYERELAYDLALIGFLYALGAALFSISIYCFVQKRVFKKAWDRSRLATMSLSENGIEIRYDHSTRVEAWPAISSITSDKARIYLWHDETSAIVIRYAALSDQVDFEKLKAQLRAWHEAAQ